uniref:FERM domain-containing protein n=1 Tax=Rhabditophanes sp. KR3021 TaxID=114890 RepID=A0AC35TMP1_9BILA
MPDFTSTHECNTSSLNGLYITALNETYLRRGNETIEGTNVVQYTNFDNTLEVNVTGGINSVTLYLMDNSHFTISLLGRGPLTVSQILEELASYINTDILVLNEMFCLWLVSPFLEIPLYHEDKPSDIRNKWQNFLDKFSHDFVKDPQSDVPCLVIRRSYLLPKERENWILEEQQNTHPEVYNFFIRILFTDAKDEYLRGSYCCGKNAEDKLTAILISSYALSTNAGSYEFDGNIQNQMNYLLRPHNTPNKVPFLTSISNYVTKTRKIQKSTLYWLEKMKTVCGEIKLMEEFLKTVRDFQMYGCVVYPAFISQQQINHLRHLVTHNSFSFNSPDVFDPVFVWINSTTFGISTKRDANILYTQEIANLRWTILPQIKDYMRSLLFCPKHESSDNYVEITGKASTLIHNILASISNHI